MAAIEVAIFKVTEKGNDGLSERIKIKKKTPHFFFSHLLRLSFTAVHVPIKPDTAGAQLY